MRGRTLHDAFIILDEAQNTTPQQMKMFLTRLGPNSKCVVTGDLTQIDLPWNVKSGLRQSLDILRDIEGIEKVWLTAEDVVRHRLVKDIIKAYDFDDERQKARREAEKAAKDNPQTVEKKVENAVKIQENGSEAHSTDANTEGVKE